MARWHAAQIELGKQKKQLRSLRQKSAQGATHKRHSSFGRRGHTPQEAASPSALETRGLGGDSTGPSSRHEAEYEEAIRESVDATSTGNPEEDEMIEKAIRASVAELQKASMEGDDQDAMRRAIQASIADAKRAQCQQSRGGPGSPSSVGSDHHRELEATLQKSMHGHDGIHDMQLYHLRHGGDDSGIETDDDENIKLSIERSKHFVQSPPVDEDIDLLQAVKQSQEDQRKRVKAESAARTEEEIVLEYVKKQSLAEEEHKRSVASNDSGTGTE